MLMPKLPPIDGRNHVEIDLIDTCNLGCLTCFRGTGAQENTATVLPLADFRQIIVKLRAEGFRNIILINWTEAFLLRSLDQYVAIVKEFADLYCWISSNLSLRPSRYLPSILSALSAGVDVLFVSVSGWTQPIYEINHAKGRVDWIRENLAGIVGALRDGRVRTGVWIRYLEWPYNAQEALPWQQLASEYGIGFESVPAHGDPFKPFPNAEAFSAHLETCRNAKVGHRVPAQMAVPEKVCHLIVDRAAIDAKGDAYLCDAYPNVPELRIGRYVDIDQEDFLLKRHTHWFCTSCHIPLRDASDQDRARYQRALEAKGMLKRDLAGEAPQLAVAPETAGGPGRMEIVLGGGVRILVGADIDAAALARVIKALSQC